MKNLTEPIKSRGSNRLHKVELISRGTLITDVSKEYAKNNYWKDITLLTHNLILIFDFAGFGLLM